MKNLYLIILTCLVLKTYPSFSQNVYLLYDKEDPQAVYGAGKLEKTLVNRGYSIKKDGTGYDYLINIAVFSFSLGSESFSIIPEGNKISIYGGDARGMIYGCLSLAEQIKYGTDLENIKIKKESPHYSLRAIKHNTPWYSYRPSSALDQHYDTVKDLKYWEAFLDMMVENRFNTLSLWNLHPFIYMILPKNFPEASPFSKNELDEWKNLHHGIIKMAKERAIDTYIVPFNIFVSPEFSKAHNVAINNYYPHYYVNGDTSEIVKRYMREVIAQTLQEYPDLTGIGLTLGEGMAGMTPMQREDWIFETYIEGIRLSGRNAKLIHRIPFSSTTESLGATTAELEQITRQAIEKEAKCSYITGPIWADLKYNWSHAHSTPTLVRVHGGEMFDTFYNPEPVGYKITYTARNEDFFALRWGVPDFIRAHIAKNSQPYIGGYFVGSETYIPALDYFTTLKDGVDWSYAFERQWLFYKLWGRLLFDPTVTDEIFKAEFISRYGDIAKNLLEAFSLSSATQLRLASLFNSTWDFTLYGEGFMALIGKTLQYISVDRLIDRPTLDPNYVSVKDYVENKYLKGKFDKDKITPPVLIKMLTNDCNKALDLIKSIDERSKENVSLMYEVSDVKAWAFLGLHLAEKLEGAMALEAYRHGGKKRDKVKAIKHLESSLNHWDQVVKITRPIYNDMHLTHYNGSSHDSNPNNFFHWEKIRSEVAKDVDIAINAIPVRK